MDNASLIISILGLLLVVCIHITAIHESVWHLEAENAKLKTEITIKDATIASLTTEKEEKVIEVLDGLVEDAEYNIAKVKIVSRTSGIAYSAIHPLEKFTEKGIGIGDRFVCNVIERDELTRVEIESIKNERVV